MYVFSHSQCKEIGSHILVGLGGAAFHSQHALPDAPNTGTGAAKYNKKSCIIPPMVKI